MNDVVSKSLHDDWVVASVDKIREDSKHGHGYYVVTRVLKSHNHQVGLGILDVDVNTNLKPIYITFNCPSAWGILFHTYVNSDEDEVTEIHAKDSRGRVVKGGVVMVLGNLSRTIASGWKADYGVIYGVEHESDASIALTPEENTKLQIRKDKQKTESL